MAIKGKLLPIYDQFSVVKCVEFVSSSLAGARVCLIINFLNTIFHTFFK